MSITLKICSYFITQTLNLFLQSPYLAQSGSGGKCPTMWWQHSFAQVSVVVKIRRQLLLKSGLLTLILTNKKSVHMLPKNIFEGIFGNLKCLFQGSKFAESWQRYLLVGWQHSPAQISVLGKISRKVALKSGYYGQANPAPCPLSHEPPSPLSSSTGNQIPKKWESAKLDALSRFKSYQTMGMYVNFNDKSLMKYY